MKSFRGAKKRFKVTGTGRVVRHQAMKRHILTKKSRARKRALGASVPTAPGDAKRVRRMLPYA